MAAHTCSAGARISMATATGQRNPGFGSSNENMSACPAVSKRCIDSLSPSFRIRTTCLRSSCSKVLLLDSPFLQHQRPVEAASPNPE